MSSPLPNQDTTPSPRPNHSTTPSPPVQLLRCKWLVAVDLPAKFNGEDTFARVRGEFNWVCASARCPTGLVARADIDDAVNIDMMDEHLVAFLWKLADAGYMITRTFESVMWMFVEDRRRYWGHR